jgi:hypothetical protein
MLRDRSAMGAAIAALLHVGCATKTIHSPAVGQASILHTPAAAGTPVAAGTPAIGLDRCAVIATTVERGGASWSDTITLPAKGKMVLESHLATTEDDFDGRLFPGTQDEEIADHLARSCARLQHLGARTGCDEVYRTQYHRRFTPAEGGGKIGQGSTGDRKPPAEQEMWVMNIMFRDGHVPPPGQRWLVSANDRCVVAVAGWEVGPGDQGLLGGMQGEVHWYLGTDNDSEITVHGPLKDQTLAPGPIECARNERPVAGDGDPDRFDLPTGPFDAALARARTAGSSAPYTAEGCEPDRRPCCRRVETLPDTLAAWRDFAPEALQRCRYGVTTRAGATLHSEVIMIVPEPVQLARWAVASCQTIGIHQRQPCSAVALLFSTK